MKYLEQEFIKFIIRQPYKKKVSCIKSVFVFLKLLAKYSYCRFIRWGKFLSRYPIKKNVMK